MNLTKLFNLIEGLIGDVATFRGLTFELAHGIMIIDFVTGIDFEGDVVDGYIIGFAPYAEDADVINQFALNDIECVKEIISTYILQ
jgi:hypothetical protein